MDKHIELWGMPARVILELEASKGHRIQIDLTGESTWSMLTEQVEPPHSLNTAGRQNVGSLVIPLMGFKVEEKIQGAIDDHAFRFGY